MLLFHAFPRVHCQLEAFGDNKNCRSLCFSDRKCIEIFEFQSEEALINVAPNNVAPLQLTNGDIGENFFA